MIGPVHAFALKGPDAAMTRCDSPARPCVSTTQEKDVTCEACKALYVPPNRVRNDEA